MKIIYKHLLRQYIPSLLYCVLGFSLIFVLCDLFGHFSVVLNAGLPLHIITLYFTSRQLPTMEYLLPASLLFATLYTLWRLGRNNEITAMRAGGISVYRIALPFLLTGFSLSILSAAIKEIAVPSAMQWEQDFRRNDYKQVKQKIVHSQPFYNAATKVRWWVGKMDIKNPGTLQNVEIVKENNNSVSVAKKIIASKARYMDDTWWLFDGRIEKYSEEGGLMEEQTQPIRPYPFGTEIHWLTEKPQDLVNDTKPPDFMSSIELIDHLERHPKLSDKEKYRRKTIFHSRLALPWACFIVILFGIPAGMKNSRQDAMTGILFAVALFLSFWAIMQAGILLGMRGMITPWLAAWLSNIIFLVAGLVMLRRV